ncbi:MAG: DnaJ domain-containing protein [Cohaesibacter sp.]|nr:DnaJ domain-containing protein [Cohaesibacter sp.]
MIYLLAGGFLVMGVWLLLKWMAYANPVSVMHLFYRLTGLALGLFSVFLMARGQWVMGLPVGAMAIALFRRKSSRAGADRESGRGSTVRTAALEMTLDHDTGIIIGQVLAGHFEGRQLDSLTEAELFSLYQEIVLDQESSALLEAYLDGRMPQWRDEFEPHMAAGERGTSDTGPMTEEEAYQVLGLTAQATEDEIVTAHRRLMKRVHPDHGGSTFLAAKINAAKAVLLRKHG